jgi:hypothetical protein
MRIIGCLCAAALATAACAGGTLTSPSAATFTSAVEASAAGQRAVSSASFPRQGVLEIEKECSEYTGLAGSFCTNTSSSLEAIPAGSRIVYAQAAGASALDSDITIDLPGPGNNTASGHCFLVFATGVGLCTISGGTGQFTWLQANEAVSYLGGFDWAWSGTYTFNPRD